MSLTVETPTSNEWHILKGETKYGPYSYEEMLQMMQNNMLFGFDYTWNPQLESWTPISELPEFSPDRISRLVEKSTAEQCLLEKKGKTAGGKVVFNKRANERVMVNIEALCHDNARTWNGKCENLSAGGALIYMENPFLLPGHLINIYLRATNGKEVSFNATCEVLAKRLTKKKIQHNTGIYYVVKFVQMLPSGKQQLDKWISDKKNKRVA